MRRILRRRYLKAPTTRSNSFHSHPQSSLLIPSDRARRAIPTTMQFLWALAAGIAATAIVPLITILLPYAWFNVYIHQFPVKPSHPHIKEALASVQATSLATACLLPPLSFVSFLCHSKVESNLTETPSGWLLFSLAVDQGGFYNTLTRNTPSMDDFFALSDLDKAVDITLAYDDMFLLLQDGSRELLGVGNVLLLSSIQKTSRVALHAMYRVVLHIELSIARASFIQTIAVSGLTMLERASSFGRLAGSGTPRNFDWLANISLTSTSESVHWVRRELQSVLLACSTLEASLEKLEASGVHCRISIPIKVDFCAKTAALLQGRRAVQSLVARLMELSANLDDWEKTLAENIDLSGGGKYCLMVAIPILQTFKAALEEKMARMEKVRLSVEAVMGFS